MKSKLNRTVIFSLGALLTQLAMAQTNSIGSVIEHMRARESRLTTVTFKFSHHQLVFEAGKTTPSLDENSDVNCASDFKSIQCTSTVAPSARSDSYTISSLASSGGTATYSTVTKPAGAVSGAVGQQEIAPTTTLDFGWVWGSFFQKWSEVLAKGQFNVVGSVEDAKLGPLIEVRGITDKGVPMDLFLSPNKDWIVTRAITGKGTTEEFLVKSVTEKNGVWLCSDGVMTAKNDAGQMLSQHEFHLTSFQVNPVLESNEFAFKPPPGSGINDADTDIYYHVQPDGKWVPYDVDRRVKVMRVASPVGLIFIGSLALFAFVGGWVYLRTRLRQ